ncbi:MAG: hypothetical protein MJZ14_00140 [Paludibacteraceae bacterium]|nr:hypothetical protein [Paludibacteraceae bacterium]
MKKIVFGIFVLLLFVGGYWLKVCTSETIQISENTELKSKVNSNYMEQNLFLKAVEQDEIIAYFSGEGEYSIHIPRTPHWGYEDNGEHFYAESFSGMESCVVNNLISEEKLYDELDRSFTSCLRNNPTIDVFFDVIY